MRILNYLRYYSKMKLIGTGAFSRVYKVRRISDGKIFALKKVDISNIKAKEKLNSINEVKILSTINSKYIIKYIDAFIDLLSKDLIIITEYYPGGDLHKYLNNLRGINKRLSETVVKSYFYQLLRALSVLNKKNIMHRDLKLANIYLNSNKKKVVLGDFNVSKLVENEMAKTQTGTPFYAAPEIWRDEEYGKKADVWSLGIIIYELCNMKMPFEGNDMKELYKNIQNNAVEDWDTATDYSEDLKELVNKCLTKSIQERSDIKQLLESPYFSELKKKVILKHKKTEQKNKIIPNIYSCIYNKKVISKPKKVKNNLCSYNNSLSSLSNKPKIINPKIIPQKSCSKISKIIKEIKNNIIRTSNSLNKHNIYSRDKNIYSKVRTNNSSLSMKNNNYSCNKLKFKKKC